MENGETSIIGFILHPIRSFKRLRALEEQLGYIRRDVNDLKQWCSHDPKVSKVAWRYVCMSSDNWRNIPFESLWDFRKMLGACPHEKDSPPTPN